MMPNVVAQASSIRSFDAVGSAAAKPVAGLHPLPRAQMQANAERVALLRRTRIALGKFLRILGHPVRRARAAVDGEVLKVAIVKRPARTPEWIEKTVKDGAQQRDFLASFGFRGDRVFEPVGPFSGGEKALTASNRLRLMLIGAIVVGLCVIGGFLYQQRRANARLSRAYERMQQSEAALAASQQRLRAITDNIPAIVSHVDRDERYTFSNAYMHRLIGINEADIVGRSVREMRGDAVYATLAPNIRRALAGETVNFEGQAMLAGRSFHYQTAYIPEHDASGAVCGFFALTFDITRLKLAEAQLEREARFDPLTGVANRRHFEERLALAIARGAQTERAGWARDFRERQKAKKQAESK